MRVSDSSCRSSTHSINDFVAAAPFGDIVAGVDIDDLAIFDKAENEYL